MLAGLAQGLAALLVVGVLALLGWLLGGGATRDLAGRTVLRYGPGIRAMGVLGVIVAVLIVVLFAVRVYLGRDRPDIFILPVGLAAFFVLLSAPLLLMGFRSAVVLG